MTEQTSETTPDHLDCTRPGCTETVAPTAARCGEGHPQARRDGAARCDACGDTGRVPWMIEGDPNCYQERDSDDTIPCLDCAAEPARESDGVGLRERVEAAIAHARTNIPLLVAALDEALEGHEPSDCGVVAETQICSACAGIAVRKSDGVGLRKNERQAIESAFADNQQATGDWLITRREWRQLFAVVEKLIAARVAEAGARALDEAADGLDPTILEGVVDMSTSQYRQGAVAAWSGVERWLRDRARGLRS